MFCKDGLVKLLKSYGYNIVRLPRANVWPLQIIIKNSGSFNRLGDLSTVMMPGNNIPLPSISQDQEVSTISGKSTSRLKAGIGLTLLSDILGAMGGSQLGLGSQYEQAKFVSFEFHGVKENTVELTKLDQFLTDADINAFSKHVSKMMAADDIFLITEVLKSKKFSVESKNSSGTSLDLNVPEIQKVVGANIKVTADQEMSSKITYEGNQPLVFGFKAVRLFYDEGIYTAFRPADYDIALKNVTGSSQQAEELKTEAALINIQD